MATKPGGRVIDGKGGPLLDASSGDASAGGASVVRMETAAKVLAITPSAGERSVDAAWAQHRMHEPRKNFHRGAPTQRWRIIIGGRSWPCAEFLGL